MDFNDYSIPVHKSLQSPDLPLGIGLKPLMLLVIIGVIGVNFVSIWFVLTLVPIYIVLRMLCKADPYMIEIMIDNVLQQDEYLG